MFVLACSAQENDDWLRVYLVSYPRSGNHWLRHMIEDTTHIATSSVYRDRTEVTHLHKPFPWGGFCAPNGFRGDCQYPTENDLVVIKTHYPFFSKRAFDLQDEFKNIRIVRNPVDSIFSLHVLKNKNKKVDSIDDKTLLKYIKLHKRFQDYWNKRRPITYKYEDLLREPEIVLPNIIRKIGYRFSDEDIKRAIELNPPQGYELKHLSRYTPEQIKMIETELKEFLDQFDYSVSTPSASL